MTVFVMLVSFWSAHLSRVPGRSRYERLISSRESNDFFHAVWRYADPCQPRRMSVQGRFIDAGSVSREFLHGRPRMKPPPLRWPIAPWKLSVQPRRQARLAIASFKTFLRCTKENHFVRVHFLWGAAAGRFLRKASSLGRPRSPSCPRTKSRCTRSASRKVWIISNPVWRICGMCTTALFRFRSSPKVPALSAHP